jgi:hypothetical protein
VSASSRAACCRLAAAPHLQQHLNVIGATCQLQSCGCYDQPAPPDTTGEQGSSVLVQYLPMGSIRCQTVCWTFMCVPKQSRRRQPAHMQHYILLSFARTH